MKFIHINTLVAFLLMLSIGGGILTGCKRKTNVERYTHFKLQVIKVEGKGVVTAAWEGGNATDADLVNGVVIPRDKVVKLTAIGDASTPEALWENTIKSSTLEVTMKQDVGLRLYFGSVFYKVIFENEGVVLQTIEKEYEGQLTAPAEPTKAGYRFLGWYAEGATQAWDFARDKVTTATTLTARWERATYALTLMPTPSVGGTIKAYTDEQLTQPVADLTHIVKGTPIYLKAEPANSEIEVLTLAGGTQPTTSVVVDGDKTITASFATKGTWFRVEGADIVSNTGSADIVVIPATINGISIKGITGIFLYPGGTGGAFVFRTMKHVTIPDGVERIGDKAFEYCSNMSSIVIGSGVTSIGYRAFGHCLSLSSVTMKSTNPPTLGTYVFEYAGLNVADGFKIYVPMANVDTYKNTTQTGWTADLKSKIVGF